MKKSTICYIVSGLGLPLFIIGMYLGNEYLNEESALALILGFSSLWGFATIGPAKYFEKHEKQSLKYGSESQ